LGNTYTCSAHGFVETFGLVTTYHSNSMLCVYYACAIAFAMEERKIKKYVEPIIHGLPFLMGLVPSLFFLSNNLYNPQMGNSLPYTAWCTPSGYPMHCGAGKEMECIRGFKASNLLIIIGIVTSVASFVQIVLSLSLLFR